MTRPKLLLADDSVTIRKVVELTFADEGVDVTAVANGEEAMQKFIEIQPDIVLVDVNMPDPTGYHICEMIKQDEMTRHIPVILLVGSFEPFDQDEAERVGADGFLTKPFQSIRELVAKVDELLKPEDDSTDVPLEATGSAEEPETAESESSEVLLETTEEVEEPFAAESDWSNIAREPEAEVDEFLKAETEPDEITDDETSDIDNLYNRSFAATTRMAEDESSEMLLGDPGLDDEIIETTYPAGERERSASAFQPDEELESGAKTVKGFDWSAEPAAEREVATVADTDFGSDSMIGEEEVLDLDHNANIDTLRDMETISLLVDEAAMAEPSEEFISLVVRRVVEKLSDKVIREIAQEAVPRIAEGLIREALEDENKSKD